MAAENNNAENEKAELKCSLDDTKELTYTGIEVQPPSDEYTPLKAAAVPMDDIDFTSGFEEQHRREYAPKNTVALISVPDPKLMWYRDCKCIIMVLLLWTVLLVGTVMLILLVFTQNPWKIIAITASYIMISLLFIFLEVQSVHVR